MNEYSSDTFNQFDTNGDNNITSEEMETVVNKESFGLLTKEQCKQICDKTIKLADIDGNSKMSLGEFAIASVGDQEINRTAFESKYGSEETKKLFDRYDTNGDGKITSDEIKSVDKANDKPNGLKTGEIIGLIIGGVCLVGLIVGLIVYLSRNKKKEAQKDDEKSTGNNFDKERKDIRYTAEKNLDSVNKAKDKDKGRG